MWTVIFSIRGLEATTLAMARGYEVTDQHKIINKKEYNKTEMTQHISYKFVVKIICKYQIFSILVCFKSIYIEYDNL